jgi:NADH dehydrogenase
MKVAVTGANGFLGRYVIRNLLKNKYDVVCFVREKVNLGDVEYRYGDIRNREDVIKAFKRVDVVIHLAAVYGIIGKKDVYNINVEGVKNVIESCRINKVKKLIHMSSIVVKRKKNGIYGKTKKEAERLLNKSNLNFVVLRPTLIYGKGKSGGFGRVVNYVKNFPLVPVVGKGNVKLQPVYAGDVAGLVVKLIKTKNKEKFYDVAGDNIVTFNKFIDIIMNVLGKKKYKLYLPKSLVLIGVLLSIIIRKPLFTMDNYYGLIQDTTASTEKIKKEFGFKPIKLEEGLKRSLLQ